MHDGDAAPTQNPAGQDDLTAEHLRLLAGLRQIAFERAQALAGRVALATEDGRDADLAVLSAAADQVERSLRQIILLGDHLDKDGDERRQKRAIAQRRQAAETRKAEVLDQLDPAIERPEHTREQAERLRLDLRRWLDLHQFDADFLTRSVPDQIQRIAKTLGVDLARAPAPASPTRSDPARPASPPALKPPDRAVQPSGRAHLLATASRRPP